MPTHTHMRWLAIGLAALAFNAQAQNQNQNSSAIDRAIQASGRASANVSISAAHSIAASGQAVSAIMAVPLSAAGVVLGTSAAVSLDAANASMNAANAPIGTPLPVTNEVITVIPPNEALKAKTPATGTP